MIKFEILEVYLSSTLSIIILGKIDLNNIIIERVDERYTSKISNLIIRQSGIKQKSRMNKSIIDKISASLILESYLTMINK